MKNIFESIKKGMENAYYQNNLFSSDYYLIQEKITEYLFTVNVAQELLKNLLPNTSIHLEYDAYDFINNAFDIITWKGSDMVNKKMYRRLSHPTCRPGRIDIVLMEEKYGNIYHKRSIYGIEIKSLIRDIKFISEDLQRLTEAILEKDPICENSIKKCFIAFALKLHTPKKMFSENDYDDKKKQFLTQLENFLFLNCDDKFIQYNVKDFLIELNTAEHEAKATPEENWDSREIAYKSGAIIGIIIELKKK